MIYQYDKGGSYSGGYGNGYGRTGSSPYGNGYQPSGGYQTQSRPPRRRKKPFYKKGWFWSLLLLVLIAGGLALFIHTLPIEEIKVAVSEVAEQEVVEEDTIPEEIEEVEPVEVLEVETDTVYYFYNQLNAEDQAIYNQLLEGLLNVEETIQVESEDVEETNDILDRVWYDHAELFWWGGGYSYSSSAGIATYTFTYAYDKNEIQSRAAEIDQMDNEILDAIDVTASDYEIIKTVFEYVIDSVTYVIDASDSQNIYSSIVNKESVCAGYAREMQYILNQLDMECIYVSGVMTDGENHGWNIVECDGVYYQLDATHGDGEYDDSSQGTAEATINYAYLCSTDAEIYVDRTEIMEFDLPVCDSDDLNYYRLKDAYYETYSDEIYADMEASINSGETMWEAQFATKEIYEQVLQRVMDGVYLDYIGEYLKAQQYVGEYGMGYIYSDEKYTIMCYY